MRFTVPSLSLQHSAFSLQPCSRREPFLHHFAPFSAPSFSSFPAHQPLTIRNCTTGEPRNTPNTRKALRNRTGSDPPATPRNFRVFRVFRGCSAKFQSSVPLFPPVQFAGTI